MSPMVGAVPDDVLARAEREVVALAQQLVAFDMTIAEHDDEPREDGALQAFVASYLHKTNPDLPPQVGVLFATDGPTDVARDIAMHVAALPPLYVSKDAVPADIVESERRIAEETAREEGKPDQALPRIVEGRLNGFFKDVVLLEQPSVQDGKQSVGSLLDEAGITVTRFARFEVGAN